MADEESTQPLVGEDVAEAPEAAPAPNAKLNLLDIYHIVQELNFLRGGGGWTGTLGESITRSLLSTTWEGGGAILASVVGVVLISLSMALDLYMVHLGLKYYGDSRCEYPLDHFVTYMGLLGLFSIPLCTVNKMSIEARPLSKRQGAIGSLHLVLLVVPIIQLIILLFGCSYVFSIQPSSVTADKATTQCEVDLYNFTYWYCLIALVLIALFIWIVILLAVGLCLGSSWLLKYLPESLLNVRQTAEAHRRELFR